MPTVKQTFPLAAALVVALAGPAPAATVSTSLDGLVITGDETADDLHVVPGEGVVHVTERSGRPLGTHTPDSCSAALNEVVCRIPLFSYPLRSSLGDGDDRLRGEGRSFTSTYYVTAAGAGDDDVDTSGTYDRTSGGDGADRLTALQGSVFGDSGDDRLAANDVVDGGPGDDLLTVTAAVRGYLRTQMDGGAGADTFTGGAHTLEEVVYATRTAPVHVTDDGVANDGEAGEGDLFGSDIDGVQLGSGNDIARLASGDARGGDGDDLLEGGDGTGAFDGEEGDDRLIGGPGRDSLMGGAGADRIEGGAGDDRLFADGNVLTSADDGRVEVLDGGPGADMMEGGAGHDVVTYEGRQAPVRVTVGTGFFDDGEYGEGDTVVNANQVVGGAGADHMTARPSVQGTHYPIVLRGGAGDDMLEGDGGADVLDAGAGSDAVWGGGGDDRLLLVDRTRDTGACGDGVDVAQADPRDVVGADCETRSRRG